MQISSRLHFNYKSDEDGINNDSLHKIHPLLEVLKKTLGRYGKLGSEFSCDQATMACFCRYGHGLLSFNPQKSTGKFHINIYMLCFAITNLVYKTRIHTKDGSDANVEEEDMDEEMLNKTEKLTSDMCNLLSGRQLLNGHNHSN